MQYEIVLAPEAVEDLQNLKANLRAEVQDAMERSWASERWEDVKRLSEA